MRRVDGHSDGTTDTFTFCCPPFPDKHLYTAFGEGGLEPRLETSMNGSTSNTWIYSLGQESSYQKTTRKMFGVGGSDCSGCVSAMAVLL